MNRNHPPCTRDTPRCDFWRWERDFVRPACCTQHLQEMLFFTDDLLTRHNLFHWLDYGSLLGAVRTQDLIPWDLDGDFCAWLDDYEKIAGLEPEFRAAGFGFDLSKAPHIVRVLYSPVNILHVDLFLCRVENGMVQLGYIPDAEEWTFPLNYLEPLTPVTLRGKMFLATSPVDSFLANYRYGPDYMVPQQQPAMFDWTHVPALKSEKDTPLLQHLLTEIRANDVLLADLEKTREIESVAPVSTNASGLWFALARRVPYRLRKVLWIMLAYPFALNYWRTERKAFPFALHDLTPTLALLVLEIERRKWLLQKYQTRHGVRSAHG